MKIKSAVFFPHLLPGLTAGLLLLSLSGCKTVREIPYLQNYAEYQWNDSIRPFDITIKPKDELFIFVHSSNREVSAIFNYTEPQPIDTKQLRATAQSGKLRYFPVDNNGDIDYPLIGKINVKGLTIEQISSLVKSKIARYFTDGADYGVKTYISNYYVSVLGEVKSPNSFSVSSNKINVLEALAMAGDLTVYGLRTNVKLLRELPDGEYEIHQLDLTDANLLNSPYYYMQQRDVLYVEPNSVKAQDAKIGQTTRLWVRGAAIVVSLGSLLYRVLE